MAKNPRQQWQPHAIKIAKEIGVPVPLFLSLIDHESSWIQGAKSPVGAIGITQLMPGTAADLGVDPNDPIQNLRGGAKYLKRQLTAFNGSVEKALAAYNAGPGRVNDGSWKRIKETTRYVRSVMEGMSRYPRLAAQAAQRAAASTTASPPVIKTPQASLATGVPIDIGDVIQASAFENLGKIAQGYDPTETLSDLVQTTTAAAAQARALPQTLQPVQPRATPTPDRPQPQASPQGLVKPLKTKLRPGSEWGMVDKEGAPGSDGRRYHSAKDWYAPAGATVVSPVRGKIIEAKPSTGTSGQVFGGTVKVQAADGKVYVFRHVNPAKVRVGETVRAGESIARVVRWGDNPSGSHAHVEIWKTLEGGYTHENMLDPAVVFGR